MGPRQHSCMTHLMHFDCVCHSNECVWARVWQQVRPCPPGRSRTEVRQSVFSARAGTRHWHEHRLCLCLLSSPPLVGVLLCNVTGQHSRCVCVIFSVSRPAVYCPQNASLKLQRPESYRVRWRGEAPLRRLGQLDPRGRIEANGTYF